jgi:RNA-binding protein 5/10
VGVWYSYDQKSQQYVPCNESNNSKATGDRVNESVKVPESNSAKKVVISAPAATVKQSEKTSLHEAVQAAASAALAAEKKEKEKAKEIKLASKISLLANKKKMNNVLAMWKQRNQEGQAAHIGDDKEPTRPAADKLNSSPSGIGFSLKSKPKSDIGNSRDMNLIAGSNSLGRGTAGSQILDSDIKPRPVSNSLGTTIMGVIRGSGRGAIKSDTTFQVSSDVGGSNYSSNITANTSEMMTNAETHTASAPFKTDLSSLGSYTLSGVSGSAKRRFSEAPGQSQYRDRAAERRSLYGLSSSLPNDDGLDTSKNTFSLLLP